MKYNEIITPTIILLLLDMIFMTILEKPFLSQLYKVQKEYIQIRFDSVIACYIFLILGLWYFILKTHKPALDAFFLGILVYGVFETTNYATLTNWSLKLVAIDTLWGGILLYLTTLITYKINSRLN
jgi:uncharacterized membrane protein